MKRTTWSTLLTLALVVGLTGSAFAGTGSFNLSADATVNGTELRPGRYTASWNEDGLVRITSERGQLIKVQGKVVERTEKAARTSILKNSDGSVLELRFSGKKSVLVFSEGSASKDGN